MIEMISTLYEMKEYHLTNDYQIYLIINQVRNDCCSYTVRIVNSYEYIKLRMGVSVLNMYTRILVFIFRIWIHVLLYSKYIYIQPLFGLLGLSQRRHVHNGPNCKSNKTIATIVTIECRLRFDDCTVQHTVVCALLRHFAFDSDSGAPSLPHLRGAVAKPTPSHSYALCPRRYSTLLYITDR